jgi:hypothetical protein
MTRSDPGSVEAPAVAVERPGGGYWKPGKPVVTDVPGVKPRPTASKVKDTTIDISNPAQLPSRRLR